MERHGRYVISMEFQWNYMASRWNPMEFHGVPWNSMECHGHYKRIHGACLVGSCFHDESPVIPGESKTSTE